MKSRLPQVDSNLVYIIGVSLVAAAASLYSLSWRLGGVHVPAYAEALVAGIAILASAVVIVWATDAAQKDISGALAIAIIAVIAVLPEYSVDMYFTWMAGKHPAEDYHLYAIANMTGANRLLIGVGWAAVAVVVWFRMKEDIVLERERSVEFWFLLGATVIALLIVVVGELNIWFGAILVLMFFFYVFLVARRPICEPDVGGPGKYLCCLPPLRRRLSTTALFLLAAAAIFTNAEPFSEGLLETAKIFRINEFLLVQWLAPFASESPEFFIAIMFAVRKQGEFALATLLSSKLNQWTLLVGMIPLVYSFSSGSMEPPIPMSHFQFGEILLTAAQSALAVIMLANLRFNLLEGLVLFVLFALQFVLPYFWHFNGGDGGIVAETMRVHHLLSWFYLIAAGVVFITHPKAMLERLQCFREYLKAK